MRKAPESEPFVLVNNTGKEIENMKHKKVTCFTSVVLTALMALSPVVSYVPVLAEETDSETNQIKVEETETDDITVEDEIVVEETEESASEITVESKETMSASVEIGEVSSDEIQVTESYAAGDAIPLHIQASNPTEEDQTLVLSFWKYEEALPDDMSGLADVLTERCSDVSVTEFADAESVETELIGASDVVKSEWVLGEEDITVQLPAGTRLDDVLHVEKESAGTVTAQVAFGEELDAVQPVWEGSDITVESEDSEIVVESDDEETESEAPAIVVEDTDVESFGSVYVGDSVQNTLTETELNASDFASMRLVLMTDDPEVISNDSDVIGVYENIYLLQFTSIQQTMNAYAYYKDKVLAVEPDVLVEAADETEALAEAEISMTEEENPVAMLNEVETSEEVQDAHGVIALIDTGVSEHANVIDRVSVIDEALEGNGHGDAMLEAIVGQDAEAQVLSIRAMDDNGFGTISSLVAAMEYAMEQKVDVINLSVYAKATLSTSVLEQEIVKATNEGILVVGAAGNDGADVAGYVPGNVEEAWIIGAADETGARRTLSNYGSTVDYNVVAGSTSEATALFTGYISVHGLDGLEGIVNQGFLYSTDYQNPDVTNEDEFDTDTDVKPIEDTGEVYPVTFQVAGEAKIIFANLDGTIVKTISAKDETVTEDVPMIGVQVEILAPMFHRLDSVDVVDASGAEFTDVTLEDGCPDIVEGVRNTYFTLDALQEMSVFVNVSESEVDVPRFDIPSEQWYFEAELCGPDCLEKHVRGEEIPEYNHEEVTLDTDSPLYEILAGMSDEDKVQTADLSETPVVGRTYTGRAWISDEYFPRGPEHGGGVWQITFSSGILSGSVIGNFTCYDHGKASPRMPEPGGYSARCTSISGNGAAFDILFTPDNYSLNYQRLHVATTVTMPNGGLSIRKVSGDASVTNGNSNYSLQGAVYSIYKNGGWVKDITTNASGVASTGDSELPAGTYTVREKTPSKGYSLDPTTYTITVAGGSTASVNRKTSTEPPKTGQISVLKFSDNPDMTEGNNCYTLGGSVYGIFTDAACTKAYTNSQQTGTATTVVSKDVPNQAVATFKYLAFGTYYIKEIKSPPGFGLNPNVVRVTINASNSSETKPVPTNSEEPSHNDPATIRIEKIWDGEETATIPTLEGTQFTVWYYDGFFEKENLPDYDSYKSTAKRKWVIEVKYEESVDAYLSGLDDYYVVDELSDEFYRDPDTNAVVVPRGTLVIQETLPASGYTLNGFLMDKNGNKVSSDSDIFVTQVRDPENGNGPVSVLAGNEYHAEDTPIYGMIRLKKYDSDGKTPLSGVTFTCVGDTVGDVGYTVTTDENGEAVFKDLYPDVYTITEIETTNGHELLRDPLVVEVPTRVSQEYVDKYNIDVYNTVGVAEDGVRYDAADDIYYIHNFTYEITNNANFQMPMSGSVISPTTFVPLVAGVGILGGLGFVGLRRKKKK